MTGNTQSRQSALDIAVAALAVAFAVAVSLFSLRNNDVWWMLGVGRYILETKSFIYSEPFTFTLTGAPWSPQSWVSAIVFYLVHGVAGAPGLIVLRVVLVATVIWISLRTLARLGISWANSGILVVLVILVAHTRFAVRAHLFEYVYVAVLIGFLLTAHERKGRSYFVIPALLQVLWTNTHPSFLLGPALVALFYAGEWASERASKDLAFIQPLHRHDYRRAAILVGVVAAACFVNPNPAAFLSQPLGGEQRELISAFTLEWKSPFDPAIAGASFHPYYEILLALALGAILLSIRRLPLAALLLLVATAYLSVQSHRFRVEFALVALPLVPLLLQRGVLAGMLGRIGRVRLRVVLVVLAVALVAVTARDRIEIGSAALDGKPDRALEFIVENEIAQRPFNTIAYGSYMTWRLYGQRLHFIDGRNFDAGLHRDFLVAQRSREGLEQIVAKHRVDAFIIPSVQSSDFGMRNIHQNLTRIGGWSLVYMDEIAFVYVHDQSVPPAFLQAHAFRRYHPLTIGKQRIDREALDELIADLERAAAESPDYVWLWLDLGVAYTSRGDHERAIEVLQWATQQAPDNSNAWSRLASAASAARRVDMEIDARERAADLAPDFVPFRLELARAYHRAGRTADAVDAYESAIEIEPDDAALHTELFRVHAQGRHWDDALKTAERMVENMPASHLGHYLAAEAFAGLGRTSEAIQRGEQAIRVNPRAVDVHEFLANLYVDAQDYSKALERVESVLALDPENETALGMRARLRETLGR